MPLKVCVNNFVYDCNRVHWAKCFSGIFITKIVTLTYDQKERVLKVMDRNLNVAAVIMKTVSGHRNFHALDAHVPSAEKAQV